MNRIFFILIFLSAMWIPLPTQAQASEEPPIIDEIPGEFFYLAKVKEIIFEESQTTPGGNILSQIVNVEILNGELKGSELEIENSGLVNVKDGQGVEVGEKIILYHTSVNGEDVYYLADTYRLPQILWIIGIFFLTAVVFSRWKGATSIVGLLISIAVIVLIIVPQIIEGRNPLIITLIGTVIIALTTVYLSHGFNKRTSIAVLSIFITLGIATVLATIFVNVTKLFGLGSEQAFYLQFGSLESLNLKGLLLAGIILGSLGVLDDITTAQSATVDEIKKANPALGFRELYARGSSVGREHIASLVNTLFLAYAGASLPMFLFFTVQGNQPIWVTLNAEFIAEEIVRTLVGSIGLVLAVPITTLLAAYFFCKKDGDNKLI